MEDIQKLLDSTFPFVSDLLKRYGEFFPLASAISVDDSIAQIGTYDGNEKPLSDKLIVDLKNAIRVKKECYKVIAIFYDGSVINPETNIKADAVIVFVESRSLDKSNTFYYPYHLSDDKQLIFSNAWREENDREIF
jgi:hypothetical protein